MDHRALPFLGTIPEDVQEWLRQATLQHLWEAQPGILLRWIKEFELDQYKKIAHILFCKDWIRFNLTGALGTEYSDISGGGLLNNTTRRYEMSILEALGIPEAFDCLPEIHASTTVVGKITPQAANCTGLLSGTPVVSGLFDVVANPIGSGLTAPGRLCSIMGTWNINVALSENPVIPTKIRQCTIFGDDRYYACIDSSTTSASNLEWVLKNVLHGSIGYEEFESIISHYKSGDLTLQFMPFLHGGLRPGNPGAAFIGLNSEHTPRQICCAR
jgi:L-xylulokinase